jgi:hypothetical protein
MLLKMNGFILQIMQFKNILQIMEILKMETKWAFKILEGIWEINTASQIIFSIK